MRHLRVSLYTLAPAAIISGRVALSAICTSGICRPHLRRGTTLVVPVWRPEAVPRHRRRVLVRVPLTLCHHLRIVRRRRVALDETKAVLGIQDLAVRRHGTVSVRASAVPLHCNELCDNIYSGRDNFPSMYYERAGRTKAGKRTRCAVATSALTSITDYWQDQKLTALRYKMRRQAKLKRTED